MDSKAKFKDPVQDCAFMVYGDGYNMRDAAKTPVSIWEAIPKRQVISERQPQV
jgi:hypothetical protein